MHDPAPIGGELDLSVVIVTRNVKSLLRECLTLLTSELKPLRAEVYVVDNASSDGSAEMVRTEFPLVDLIALDHGRGFAAGNNLALRHCRGRHVLLLNSDTRIVPGAVTVLMKYLDEHPQVGMAGPQLLNPDGSIQRSCWKLPTLERILYEGLLLDAVFRRHSRIGNYEDWDSNRERDVEFIISAAVLIRSAAFAQIGLLDERYFVFGDDCDFCRRLASAGWRTHYVPTAKVVHFGGQSTRVVAPVASIVEAGRSKDRYYRKFYGLPGFAVYKVFAIMGCSGRTLLLSLMPRISRLNRAAGRNVSRSANLALLRYHLGLGDRRGLAPQK